MRNAFGKNAMQARINSLHTNTENKTQRNAEKVSAFISAGMKEPTNRAYRRHQERIAKRERSK